MFALVRRQFMALRPANADAEELFHKLKEGFDYTIEVKRPRNIKQHHLYWALCGLIAENMPEPTKKETVSDYIKLESGHVRTIRINGELRQFPDSISFSSMPQDEWEPVFERALQVCTEKIIPGLDSEAVKQELFERLGYESPAIKTTD